MERQSRMLTQKFGRSLYIDIVGGQHGGLKWVTRGIALPGVHMNGQQIESMLDQIDENVDLARDEAMQYIRKYQSELAQQLATRGYAMIKTNAGELRLCVDDLNAVAA